MSMRPGATTWPRASITRWAGRDDRRSSATIRPALTLTSASRPGAPVPAIRWPPRISRRSLAASSPAPHPPELLTRPASRPLERGVRVAGSGGLRRPHLGEVLDLEAAGPEPPDPVAVRHVKLDSRISGPLDA